MIATITKVKPFLTHTFHRRVVDERSPVICRDCDWRTTIVELADPDITIPVCFYVIEETP